MSTDKCNLLHAEADADAGADAGTDAGAEAGGPLHHSVPRCPPERHSAAKYNLTTTAACSC